MILTGEEGTFSQGVGHVARLGQVSRDSSLTLSSAFVDAGVWGSEGANEYDGAAWWYLCYAPFCGLCREKMIWGH